MHVIDAAWIGAGAPPPPTAPRRSGSCARCAAAGADLIPVQAAISKTFTAFDGWSEPRGTGLCGACAWAYSTPDLRAAAHVVTRDPVALQRVGRSEVRDLLLAGAVAADVAVVVPLRPGRKHVLPTATWGRVTVDDAQLPWADTDAHRLSTVNELRTRGFGSRMLAGPAPPFRVLCSLPRDLWQPTMRAWDELAPWRTTDNPWLPLALHVTTPTEERPQR